MTSYKDETLCNLMQSKIRDFQYIQDDIIAIRRNMKWEAPRTDLDTWSGNEVNIRVPKHTFNGLKSSLLKYYYTLLLFTIIILSITLSWGSSEHIWFVLFLNFVYVSSVFSVILILPFFGTSHFEIWRFIPICKTSTIKLCGVVPFFSDWRNEVLVNAGFMFGLVGTLVHCIASHTMPHIVLFVVTLFSIVLLLTFTAYLWYVNRNINKNCDTIDDAVKLYSFLELTDEYKFYVKSMEMPV